MIGNLIRGLAQLTSDELLVVHVTMLFLTFNRGISGSFRYRFLARPSMADMPANFLHSKMEVFICPPMNRRRFFQVSAASFLAENLMVQGAAFPLLAQALPRDMRRELEEQSLSARSSSVWKK